MANFVKLTPIKNANRNGISNAVTTSALFTAAATNGATTPSYGAYYESKARQDKIALLVQNTHESAAKSFTVKAGNHGVWGADGDLTFEIAAGKTVLITLDTGKYKFAQSDAAVSELVGGSIDVKGCVVLVADSTDVKFCLIEESI